MSPLIHHFWQLTNKVSRDLPVLKTANIYAPEFKVSNHRDLKQKKKTKRNYSSTNKNSQLLLLGDDEVSEGPEVGKGADAVAGPDHARRA